MAFLRKKRNRLLDEFDADQRLYAAVSQEFDEGDTYPELRARVLEEANGNVDFARTRFIEERLNMLVTEPNATLVAAVQESQVLNRLDTTKLPTFPSIAPTTPLIRRSIRIRKAAGYFVVLSGLLMTGVAILYFSLSSTRSGVYFLSAGAVFILAGLVSLKSSDKLAR